MTESLRLSIENHQLKKQLEKEIMERIRLEREYRELAEYVQGRGKVA
jgi:regulator of replication initiation timing